MTVGHGENRQRVLGIGKPRTHTEVGYLTVFERTKKCLGVDERFARCCGVAGDNGQYAVEDGGKPFDGSIPVAPQTYIGYSEPGKPVGCVALGTDMQSEELFVVEPFGEIASPRQRYGCICLVFNTGYDKEVFHRMRVMSPLRWVSCPLWQRIWQV